jgi:hypothetical protein
MAQGRPHRPSCSSPALVDLRAVAENYQQLSGNLAQSEGQIQASRDTYNSDAQAYNTKIQIFPNSIIAKRGGFQAREFFEIGDAAERDSGTTMKL